MAEDEKNIDEIIADDFFMATTALKQLEADEQEDAPEEVQDG